MRFILALAALSLLLVHGAAEACSLPGLDSNQRLRAPAEGLVIRDFGSALSPGRGRRDGERYEGQAYRGEVGDDVVTPQAGVVIFAGRMDGLGNAVQIAHGGGFVSLYAHLQTSLVAEGECLEPGKRIGTIGCTGFCSTPSLYFQLSRLGQPVDPEPFLRRQAPPPEIAETWRGVDREKLFDAVVATVEAEFLDRELLQRIGWKDEVAQARQSILQAPSIEAAIAGMNELLSKLRTSHTGLFTPDQYEYYILQDILGEPRSPPQSVSVKDLPALPVKYPGIGVFTQRVGEKHFVDGVLEGSNADKAGLRFGDEIVSVDGAPYSPVAAFRGKANKSVVLEVRRKADAAPERVSVLVDLVAPGDAFAGAGEKSARIITKEGKRIGYVHIWAFKDSVGFEKALDWINKQSPAVDYLVVDARAKVGGLSTVVRRNLELLDKQDEPYWGEWSSGERATWHPAYRDENKARGDDASTKPKQPRPAYRGRAALLINHQTRSAGEIMAYGFKRNNFGRVFGTTTAGAVVTGYPYLMPGGLMLYLAKIGHFFDGKPLEANGVAPDLAVARPLEYAEGADPVLDAAVDALVSGSQ